MIAVPFERHSSVIVCGCSQSGKTTFVYDCIKNKERLFDGGPPDNIHYFYGIFQPLFNLLESQHGVICHYGPPTEDDLDEITKHGTTNMIIIDDLMDQMSQNNTLCKLFTQGCHHKKMCTFFLTQNLYFGGKYQTTVNRNTHYYVFTRSPANLKTVDILSRQLFSNNSKQVVACYKDIMKDPRGIMVIDVHPKTVDDYRIRSNIFGDTIIYKLD